MAGQGSGSGKRGPRAISRRPPRAGQSANTTAAIDEVLDALDEAMLAGDRAQVAALTTQLWDFPHQRLPGVLVERLRTGRERLPGFAFELLGGFAGPGAPTHLKRVAAAAEAADIVRWGARRRAGWPERGESKARLSFLDSLSDADGTLIEALAQAASRWPPDTGVVQEVLAYVNILPSTRRLSVLRRALDAEVPSLDWLLRAVLHLQDRAVQHLAITALLDLGDRAAAGALARLAQTAGDSAVAEEATAAARRLQLRIVEPGSTSVQAPARPWPELDQAWASAIDGDGGQMLVVTRSWNEQARLLATFFWKDQWGVRDAWGVYSQPADALDESLQSMLGEMGASVSIGLDQARGMLTAAVQASATHGHALPPVLEVWQPFCHDGFPPAMDEAVASVELAEGPLGGRREQIRRSAALLDHPAFLSWFFNPEEIEPFLADMGPLRWGRQGNLDTAPLIKALIDAPRRDVLRQRLRRQAWLLAQQGERDASALALAVAASLADASPADLARHPFLQAMIERSLINMAGAFLLGDRP